MITTGGAGTILDYRGTAAEPLNRRARYVGIALAAALLAALGSAWFAVGAGTDYAEPVAMWGD